MNRTFFAQYQKVMTPVAGRSVAEARATWIAANPDKDASKLTIRKPLNTLQRGRR